VSNKEIVESLSTAISPIAHVEFNCPDFCRTCKAQKLAVIDPDRQLYCVACGASRGDLGRRLTRFLTRCVALFGQPTEPVVLRKPVGWIESLSLVTEPTHSGQLVNGWLGRRRRAIRSRSPAKPKIRQGNITMDMKQFSGEAYIKVDDVRDGPLTMRIAAVKQGGFGRPDLVFQSGEIFSLNQTNNRILVRAYGDESKDWIVKQIQLALGKAKYKGELHDSVVVKPLDPPVEKITPIASKPASDMDDEIPFN
jgi:hypothetical protein